MAVDYCPLCFDHKHTGDDACPLCNDHEHYSAMDAGEWDPNTADIAKGPDGCPGWWLISLMTIAALGTAAKKIKQGIDHA